MLSLLLKALIIFIMDPALSLTDQSNSFIIKCEHLNFTSRLANKKTVIGRSQKVNTL